MFVCVHVGVLFSAHRSLPRRVRLPPFDLLAVAVRALSFPKCRPTLVCSPPRSSSTLPFAFSRSRSPCPLCFSISGCSPPILSPPATPFCCFPPTILLFFSPYLLFPPSAPSRSPSERLRIPKGADAIKMLILSVYRER